MTELSKLPQLLKEVEACTVCSEFLELGPRPVVRAHHASKILIIGQAPGQRVHHSGIPWKDPSGVTLRDWLAVDEDTFYDPQNFAILPMGFCYPGKGKSGDLPPRPECAPLWHERLLNEMPGLRLTLLIGQYAQKRYLGDKANKKLTDNVRAWRSFFPDYLPLPHPSPRNKFWLKHNPWFLEEVIPELQTFVKEALK